MTILVLLTTGCANIQPVDISEINQKSLVKRGIEPGRHVRISLKSGETFDYEVVAVEANHIVRKFPKRISGQRDRRISYSEINEFKIIDRAPGKTTAVSATPIAIIIGVIIGLGLIL